METSLAQAFYSTTVAEPMHTLDDELCPLLEVENVDSSDNEIFWGTRFASITDLDIGATMQALPTYENKMTSSSHPQPKFSDESLLRPPSSLPHDSMPLSPSASHDLPKCVFVQYQRQAQRPTISPPSSIHGSSGGRCSGMKDSEEILNAPVKSLTEEEKKLRRRAQVAKSARKHRNRQKEELMRLREQVRMLQEQMATMSYCHGSCSLTSTKREQEVVTHLRKRKELDDRCLCCSCATSERKRKREKEHV